MSKNINSDEEASSRSSDFSMYKVICDVAGKVLGRGGNGQEIQEFVEQHMGDEEEVAEGLTKHEKRLIKNALAFDKVSADEVEVPRSEVVYVHDDDSFDEIWAKFLEHRHSRIPVCGNDLDDVKGFLTLKDVVGFVNKPKSFEMGKVLRACTFVPETLALPEVLQKLRKDKVALAVVIDEYGGTAGIVTLKDILAELVGDIDDEQDAEEPRMIVPTGSGKWQVDSRIELEDLVKKTKIGLPDDLDEDVETGGGLVLHMAGRVPIKGEEFVIENTKITVLHADGRRVKALEVKKL